MQSVGDANNDAWFDEWPSAQRALDAARQQRFDQVKVDDDAILNGVDGLDALRSPSDHLMGIVSDRDHALGSAHTLHGDNRGLIDDDASPTHHNDCFL